MGSPLAAFTLQFFPFSLPMEGTEDWKVCDVIDLETKEWSDVVLYELFIDMEADLILKIPLSLRSSTDKLIWHFDPNEMYCVKTDIIWQESFMH